MKTLYYFDEFFCLETVLNELHREVCTVQFLLSAFRSSAVDPFLYLEHIETTLESVSDQLFSLCKCFGFHVVSDELFQTLIE